MLEVRNISSGYGKKQVLFDVSFTVRKGDVLLLTGGNGSGKSTALKCIYNQLPCWSGEICFEGKKINELKPSDLIKKGIVYIPQKDFYFENLTVEENLEISGNTLARELRISRIMEVYKLTGLEPFKKRKPFNLSGGERKILAFAMGLIHKPRLLIFDEPFAGVDAKNSRKIIELFMNEVINPDNGVILVEHKDDAKDLYNNKIKMELGRIKNN
jgi:branched-chain amino acid transport system ATP-binding protein